MIEENTNSAFYERDLEVLCTIPVGKPGVLISDLADDFDMGEGDMWLLLAAMRDKGYGVGRGTVDGERCAWLSKLTARESLIQCYEYWHQMKYPTAENNK